MRAIGAPGQQCQFLNRPVRGGHYSLSLVIQRASTIRQLNPKAQEDLGPAKSPPGHCGGPRNISLCWKDWLIGSCDRFSSRETEPRGRQRAPKRDGGMALWRQDRKTSIRKPTSGVIRGFPGMALWRQDRKTGIRKPTSGVIRGFPGMHQRPIFHYSLNRIFQRLTAELKVDGRLRGNLIICNSAAPTSQSTVSVCTNLAGSNSLGEHKDGRR